MQGSGVQEDAFFPRRPCPAYKRKASEEKHLFRPRCLWAHYRAAFSFCQDVFFKLTSAKCYGIIRLNEQRRSFLPGIRTFPAKMGAFALFYSSYCTKAFFNSFLILAANIRSIRQIGICRAEKDAVIANPNRSMSLRASAHTGQSPGFSGYYNRTTPAFFLRLWKNRACFG